MSIRLRLTLIYGGLFFIAGLVLVAILYGLLARSLDPDGPIRSFQNRGPVQSQPPQNSGEDQPDDDNRPVEERVAEARRDERREALRQIRRQGLVALIATGGGAILVGWLVAGRVLSPVREITLYAQQATEKTLDQRIHLAGPEDELKELADTIDGMLDRLQDAFESQRRFSAEASHELRTPLAIMHAEADVTLAAPDATDRERVLAASIISAVDRAERLIDGLLALARSESSLRDHDQVDLAELVGNVVGEQVRSADQAGIELDLTLGTATVNGDRTLLWRLAGNLIENGIRYGARGGWVRVSVDTVDALAVFTVANNGPAVPAGQVERLFEPFAQGDHGHRVASGHGLGLAIVRSVTDAHGGTVTAAANPEGGLTVTVSIPSSLG